MNQYPVVAPSRTAIGTLALLVALGAAQASAMSLSQSVNAESRYQVCNGSCSFGEMETGQFVLRHANGDGLDVSGSLITSYRGSLSTSAHADLRNGALHASLSAVGMLPASAVSANSVASIGDTYALQNPDGTPYQGAITVQMDITGLVQGSGTTGWMGSIGASIFRPGYFDAFAAGGSALTDFYVSGGYLGGADVSIAPTTTFPNTLTATVTLPADGRFEWFASIFLTTSFAQDAQGSKWVNLDFSHTALMSFGVPEGVGLVVESGVLPRTFVVASPVPEPATWALWLGGGALLSAFVRRRRV